MEATPVFGPFNFFDLNLYLKRNHFIYIFDIDNKIVIQNEILNFRPFLDDKSMNDILIKSAGIFKENNLYYLDLDDMVITSKNCDEIYSLLNLKILAMKLNYQIVFPTSEFCKIIKSNKPLYSFGFIKDDLNKTILIKPAFSPSIVLKQMINRT